MQSIAEQLRLINRDKQANERSTEKMFRNAADKKKALLDIIDGKNWTPAELAEELGVSKNCLHEYLRGLIANGQVIKFGSGNQVRYTLSNKELKERRQCSYTDATPISTKAQEDTRLSGYSKMVGVTS